MRFIKNASVFGRAVYRYLHSSLSPRLPANTAPLAPPNQPNRRRNSRSPSQRQALWPRRRIHHRRPSNHRSHSALWHQCLSYSSSICRVHARVSPLHHTPAIQIRGRNLLMRAVPVQRHQQSRNVGRGRPGRRSGVGVWSMIVLNNHPIYLL